jgi:single-strand DNA-binding protein
MSLNKVQLIGFLGQDPEIKTLQTGMKVANFSLATSESYKDKDGQKVTKTEWHNIVAWGVQADIIEKYLHKGKQIYAEGKLTHRKWEDKNKNKKETTEIVLSNFVMLGGGGKKEDGSSEGSYNEPTTTEKTSTSASAKSASASRYTAPDVKAKNEPEEAQVSGGMTPDTEDLPF